MAVVNSPYYDEITRHPASVNVFMCMSIVTFPVAFYLIASCECLHNYFVSIKKTEILNFALICYYCQLLVKKCLNRGTCSKRILTCIIYWGEMQEPEVPLFPSSVSKAKLARYICRKRMKKRNLRRICGKTETFSSIFGWKDRHWR